MVVGTVDGDRQHHLLAPYLVLLVAKPHVAVVVDDDVAELLCNEVIHVVVD